jgi:hypothetical protein
VTRAQSHVVGVALLLGLTVVALGGLTAAVGSVMDSQAASADAARLADEMDRALQPVQTTGHQTGRLHFSGGHLETVDRELRILRNGSVVATREAGGLVFEAEDRRVAFLAGAILRGQPGGAWREADPPITDSARNDVIVVGAPVLGAGTSAVGGEGGVTVPLRTNVSHARTDLGRGHFAVAIETRTPDPFERFARAHNATVSTTDFDGDGIPSVVAEYPGQRQGYLVTHNLSLEVGHG